MDWTSADVMSVLYILVAVMLIIVLYHILFIVVDLRKAMRRVDNVSEAVETMIVKPLAIADKTIDWLMQSVAEHGHKPKHHAEHPHHHKKDAE